MGTLYGKKHNYNLDVFYNENDISYYLLGAFMTDGCIKNKCNQITFSSKDKDWVKNIRDIICPTMIVRKHNGSLSFAINSKLLKEWFISKGCTPSKSLTLTFPTVPEKYLPDFIRGCIDGDGSLGIWGKNKIVRSYLCSSSLEFLQSYSKHLSDRGIINCLVKSTQKKTAIINGKKITRRSDHWRVDTNNKHTQKLLMWIYYSDDILSMPRKNKIAHKMLSHKLNPIGRAPNIEKQNKAKELRATGMSLRHIAQLLNTSNSRIHCWAKS